MFDASRLVEVGRRMAGVDVSTSSEDELLSSIVELERLDSLLAVTRAHVLAELDGRGTTDRVHGLRTAGWVARDAERSPAVVGIEVRDARRLRTWPALDVALCDGRISIDHARALSRACNRRNLDAMTEMLPLLIDKAAGMEFRAWTQYISYVAAVLDQDGPHDPNDELAKNTLRLSDGLDGMGAIQARFTQDQWIPIKQALNDEADVLFRWFTQLHELDPNVEVPARDVLLALALADLLRRAQGIDLDSTQGPRTEATIVLKPTDLPPGAPEPDDGDDTYDAAGPACRGGCCGGHDDRSVIAVDRDGLPILASVLAWFLCGADGYAVVVDSLGNPVNLSRLIRYPNRGQRRALLARDGGCAFPGCGARVHWCDAHHICPYSEGGETDLCNLMLLCRFHHGVVHRHGWAIHTNPDGWFYFQTPNGETIWAQRHFKRRTDPPPDPVYTPKYQKAA